MVKFGVELGKNNIQKGKKPILHKHWGFFSFGKKRKKVKEHYFVGPRLYNIAHKGQFRDRKNEPGATNTTHAITF